MYRFRLFSFLLYVGFATATFNAFTTPDRSVLNLAFFILFIKMVVYPYPVVEYIDINKGK